MTSSAPLPTDNIYKFACLFGRVLIVSSIFAYVSIYTSSLDKKIRYSEVVIPLDAKAQRTKVEEDLLTLNRRLIEVTKSNEKFAVSLIAIVLIAGGTFSFYGAIQWHQIIQRRDDKLAELQLRKLEAEIAKLQSGHPSLALNHPTDAEGVERDG